MPPALFGPRATQAASRPTIPQLVLRDPRNATGDYLLPLARVIQLASQGHLVWDATNGAYAHAVVGSPRFASQETSNGQI